MSLWKLAAAGVCLVWAGYLLLTWSTPLDPDDAACPDEPEVEPVDCEPLPWRSDLLDAVFPEDTP